MKSIHILALILTLFSVSASSQTLPDRWSIIDEHVIASGRTKNDKFYDVEKLEEIRIYFNQSNYWNLLTNNYASKTDILATVVYDGVTYDSVGVRFKGQTSYRMSTGQKKSFNITMDYKISDQKLKGYKTLNLNNAFDDPALMREVLYYSIIKRHTEALQSNFIRLYINDVYWGLYNNTQQPNKTFLGEWYVSNDGINMRADVDSNTSGGPGGPGPGGMWGDGTAAFNYLGQDTTVYQKYYTLKSSGVEDPWGKLALATKILNTYSGNALRDTIGSYLNIDKILWHLACEIVFADDDSYIYKGKMDYYLYYDPISNLWTTYDYDANSTFFSNHVNWSPFYNADKVNYPLLNKLLAIPEYRQRYLAYLRTIIQNSLGDASLSLIDQYVSLIQSSAFEDTKKSTTNAAFTSSIGTLKSFINTRRTILLSNGEVNRSGLKVEKASIISDQVEWGKVYSNSEVIVHAQVSSTNDVKEMNAYMLTNLNSKALKISLIDNGVYPDATKGDGIYSALMPSLDAGNLVSFYIETLKNDAYLTASYFPEGAGHEMFYYVVESKPQSNSPIVINEFMPSNTQILDEYGEADDWIELYNTSGETVDISGYSISDKSNNLLKFTFESGISIPPYSYLIIWADEDGSQGNLHVNFKLSADGEAIYLSDASNNLIDSYEFGAIDKDKTYARKPNGHGNFVVSEPTFNASNDVSTVNQVQLIDWTFHPNPAQNYITFNTLFTEEDVRVYDINGRLAHSEILSSSKQTINVEQLPRGMYLVKHHGSTKKLIIVR
ncbi:MAG: CotH kinase family protein [Lewinellaceae bacterium]|nr:CotH kinase family protein [Lewinellaceae bacterium]